MGRAPRPGAVPRLADLRRVPPQRGPPSNRGSHRVERLLGIWGADSARPPRSARRHRHRARHARAGSHGRVRRTRRQSRDSPPSPGRPPRAGGVDRQVCPPRPPPRRDHDRRTGRTTGVRRMGGVAGRRRRRDPVLALPARAPQPARCTSPDGPPRATGRSALLRRVRGLRHGRRPRRRAAFARHGPGAHRRILVRALRSKARAGRSGSPAHRASASGNGPGRPSRSSIEIRRNQTAFGSFTPAEKTEVRRLAGWNRFHADPGEYRHKLDVLERHCEAAGRDPGTIWSRAGRSRARRSASSWLSGCCCIGS